MSDERKSLLGIIIPAIIVIFLIIFFTFVYRQPIEIVNYTNDDAASIALNDSAVDLNSADFESLVKIDGIGEVTAQKIIDYRTENGGFKYLEELKNIDGIGDKTYEMLVKYLYIE